MLETLITHVHNISGGLERVLILPRNLFPRIQNLTDCTQLYSITTHTISGLSLNCHYYCKVYAQCPIPLSLPSLAYRHADVLVHDPNSDFQVF